MSKGNEKNDNGGINAKKWTTWVFILVLVLYLGYFSVMCWFFPGNLEKRGQFGDMFGALGALFSGLAFAGLIITIMQQREDLKNQRDEINLQRQDLEAQTEALRLQKEEIAQTNEELKSQRKEMEEQNKTIMLQRFENTFFNMLDLQQTIVNELSYETVDGEYHGRMVLNIMYRQIRTIVYKTRQLKDDDPVEKYLDCYYSCVFSGVLDHYFRHLYRIIKFVDESTYFSDKEKYCYICLLRAQLSKDELLMIFYNCLSNYGNEKFKPLIEKYALLRNVRSQYLLRESHYGLYANGAYAFML